MVVIKRYPNRKLYHTGAKQYITLEGIADLIRKGEEIQVIDHASGEDLTTITLTQIILEREKQQGGLLSNTLLTGLIRTGGERLSAIRRESLIVLEEQLEKRLRQLQIPTRADLNDLYNKLEELSSKLEEVAGAQTERGGKPSQIRHRSSKNQPHRDEVKE